ncbi:MAG TPA: DUF1385 domain-containing protein [Solirubrobacterales bacterium]
MSQNGAHPDPPLRLGGMALKNGLLVHGPTSWAAAARAPEGTIRVASGPKPTFPGPASSMPVLRGPLRLAEGFAFIPIARRNLPIARLPFEDLRVLAAALVATAASAAIRNGKAPIAVREALAAGIGLMPALVALRGSELAAYHGVEHKSIGGYERGVDAAEVAKEHERCGSHLVAPMLAFSLAGQLIVERLVAEPGRLARGIAAIGGISAAVELFVWSERNPDHPLARACRRPGTEIQRVFATREPTSEQMEVGTAAMDEILRVEGVRA